jgi:hypothetical protein
MRDLHVDEFADELREELRAEGIEIPRPAVKRLTKHFFDSVQKIISGDTKVNIAMYGRDIQHIYKHLDVKGLCDELANGETYMTADYLMRKKKLSRKTIKYMKRNHRDVLDEDIK